MSPKPMRRALARQEGFTLVEVLTAAAILTVALLGVAAAVMIQSSGIAASLTTGQAAVTRGYYISTAIMLAQQVLEEVKRLDYKVSSDPYGSGELAGFPDSDCVGFPEDSCVFGGITFSRQVRVEVPFTGVSMKRLTVTVTFTLPKEYESAQESVSISTLVAARPD